MNLKHKEGYNSAQSNIVSNISEGDFTTGNGTNHLISTNDIKCKLADMGIKIHHQQDYLASISPTDNLLSILLLKDNDMDNLSLNLSISSALAEIFKDTKNTNKRFTSYIGELYHSIAPATKWKHQAPLLQGQWYFKIR